MRDLPACAAQGAGERLPSRPGVTDRLCRIQAATVHRAKLLAWVSRFPSAPLGALRAACPLSAPAIEELAGPAGRFNRRKKRPAGFVSLLKNAVPIPGPAYKMPIEAEVAGYAFYRRMNIATRIASELAALPIIAYPAISSAIRSSRVCVSVIFRLHNSTTQRRYS